LLLASWQQESIVLLPGIAGSFDATAVKDPSIVFAEGRWHLFYTARGNGKYSLGYVAAPRLETLQSQPRMQLSALAGNTSTYAAPQVFFFRPQKRWFLIYQTSASNYQPMFSTTKTIGDPNSWSTPQELVRKQERSKWIDFWIICDDQNAYLFFTRDHHEVVAMQTSLAAFPYGFSKPKPVFAGVHEAVHIYKENGKSKYSMLFEVREPDLTRRYGRAQADHLLGPWRLIEEAFARASHGELLRISSDERLEADLTNPRFLIQALPNGSNLRDYPELPWRLKLIQSTAGP